MEDSVEYIKDEPRSELSFVWQATEKHRQTVKQTLHMFSQVNLLLTKDDTNPFKFKVNYLVVLCLILF